MAPDGAAEAGRPMLRPDKNLALEEDIPRNPKPTKEKNTSLRTLIRPQEVVEGKKTSWTGSATW